MKIIIRLALSRITSKKARSGVICAAIFLTMVLFMTVVSISMNLFSGYALMMRLASGTDYHGYLRGAAFTLPGEELRDAAQQSNDIAEAVVSSNVALYAMHEDGIQASSNFIRAIEKEEDLQHFYTDVIEGNFPANDTEILVNPLYFPDTKIGDTIGLYYAQYADRTARTAFAEFTVNGLIKSRTDAQMHVVMRYSDTLEETYGFSDQYLNVYFLFDNSMNLTGKYDALVNEMLGEYKQPDYDVYGLLNPAYLEASASEALNPANIFLIVFSAAVVFLCSFLLIYNVYSIALTQDMQAFGLLNVIGTTHRQMRQMICIQSLVLFAVTLPAGLIAGYFIGWRMLSPLLFSSLAYEGLKFEFSLWIPLFTVMLTLFTLLWSATRPLNRLKALTPIATVDYSPAADLPKRYVRKKNFVRRNRTPNTGRMAKYAVSRNRKKTVISALSMSVSVILFMLIATLCDYMLAYTYDNLQLTDYILALNYTYRMGDSAEEHTMPVSLDCGMGFSEEYIRAVESSVYTENVWRIRTAVQPMQTSARAQRELTAVREQYQYFDHYPILLHALAGETDVLVIGIPDDLFGEIRMNEDTVLGDNYMDGYAVYDGYQTAGIHDTEGNILDFAYFREGETVTLGQGTYTIKAAAASTPTIHFTGWLSTSIYRAVLYLPERAFLHEFGEGLTWGMLVDAKEDCYDLMRRELEALPFGTAVDDAARERYLALDAESVHVKQSITAYSAGIDGRMDALDNMRHIILSIQTVGYSLAAMIFLIGTLNIVNTALSSAAERKREFAMLEAVGMTERQMMRMLLTECLFSGGVAVLITICAGFPLIAVIINTAMDALVPLNWIAGVIMLAACIAVSVFSGVAAFRLTRSAPVVERIKAE